MALLQDLIVYRVANELREEIIRLAESPSAQEDFRFRSQLLAAAGSVPANIAEGYARLRHAEFVRFLDFAMGSLRETEEWLRDGEARKIWRAEDLSHARQLCRSLTSALHRFRRYLRNHKAPQ